MKDHELDPEPGQVLEFKRLGDDAFLREVVVGWDPNASEPSDTLEWPMLREHVRPAISTVSIPDEPA